MAKINVHASTVAYLAAEQDIPDDASTLEIWAVDADPATEHAPVWLQITGNGKSTEFLVPAGPSYTTTLGRGRAALWTYNVRAVIGTPLVNVIFT